MKRSMIDWTARIALVALMVPIGSAAAEPEQDDSFGAFLGVGFGDEQIVGHNRRGHANPLVGIRWDHSFCNDVSFFADLSYLEYESRRSFGNTKEVATRLGMQKLFGGTDHADWFFSGAGGYARFDPTRAASESSATLGVGFGQRLPITLGDGAFQWEVRPDWVLDGITPADGGMLNVKVTVGWSWGFGRPSPDADGDGVADCRDSCASTPRGAVVDGSGCPQDSDGDGVYDGLDGCPDTTKGWPVDERGCPRDADADGVPDGGDDCPSTPAQAHVDARGCPTDGDGDGVYDGLDRCPDTLRGARVDATGCPQDGDGDGVYDGLDQCPDSPRGTRVDASGCPIPEPKAAPIFEPGKKSLVLEGVHFEVDKAVLMPDSTTILDRVAASLRDWPEVRVEVGGHTDSDGRDAYNLRLSQRRAEAVVRYLTDHGVARSRMLARGYGESRPIAANRTKEGKARNRRVELTQLD